MTIDAILDMAPVIPVLVLEGSDDPAALAVTLVDAGLPVIEVTLRTRTPSALESIRAMAEVPGAVVGAGTVLDERQLDQALAAGARFIVSPGLTDRLARAAAEVPFLPGVATAGDIMRGRDLGLASFKFFPAEAAGGIAALKALSAPFAGSRFCPTGGITAATAPDWLALDCVACVGGSWVVPAGATLERVGELARAAAVLRGWPAPDPARKSPSPARGRVR